MLYCSFVAAGAAAGIGIAIAIAAIAGIIIAVFLFLRHRRRTKKDKPPGQPEVPPATRDRSYSDLNEVAPMEYGAIVTEMDTIVHTATNKDKWAIKFDEVEFGDKIGSGAFGVVYSGTFSLILAFLTILSVLMQVLFGLIRRMAWSSCGNQRNPICQYGRIQKGGGAHEGSPATQKHRTNLWSVREG
jgi:hypothetical protein